MKQRHIPQQLATPPRKTRDGMPVYVCHGDETPHDLEHATCEADNAIFVQKFRKSRHRLKPNTDDRADTDNEMKHCSRWTVGLIHEECAVTWQKIMEWKCCILKWNLCHGMIVLPLHSCRYRSLQVYLHGQKPITVARRCCVSSIARPF